MQAEQWNPMTKKDILGLIDAERRAFRAAKLAGDRTLAWTALEREHVIGQGFFVPHLRSHVSMLVYAIVTKDGREIIGQVFRLALAPLGNLTGKLPWGNTGRANVSAFTPMPYPDDLAAALSSSVYKAR